MKITVAGSGAMGCRFGGALFAAGHEVVLLDGWREQRELNEKARFALELGFFHPGGFAADVELRDGRRTNEQARNGGSG